MADIKNGMEYTEEKRNCQNPSSRAKLTTGQVVKRYGI